MISVGWSRAGNILVLNDGASSHGHSHMDKHCMQSVTVVWF
jgi:hypothetical protein